jgi:DNA-directed RNA polymerase specialized sigma24 family protein
VAAPGNHGFVERLATEYGQRLRRFFSLRVRQIHDIPDLAQEVYLRLLRVDRHELIRNPENYLFTVARCGLPARCGLDAPTIGRHHRIAGTCSR